MGPEVVHTSDVMGPETQTSDVMGPVTETSDVKDPVTAIELPILHSLEYMGSQYPYMEYP